MPGGCGTLDMCEAFGIVAFKNFRLHLIPTAYFSRCIWLFTSVCSSQWAEVNVFNFFFTKTMKNTIETSVWQGLTNAQINKQKRPKIDRRKIDRLSGKNKKHPSTVSKYVIWKRIFGIEISDLVLRDFHYFFSDCLYVFINL